IDNDVDDEGGADEGRVPPFQTPKGVHDILPHDHEYHTYIKKIVRHRCRQAGFKRITTPMFEFTEVFKRSIGEVTDVVSKEMYTFEDRKGRSLTLKPEGTASICRAYIQHGMQNLPQPVELYYIEPHFRYERPQAGRYRQFWQFGFEMIGETDPALDAQVILLAYRIYQDLGIAPSLKLQINNIGDLESRKNYVVALKDYYFGKERYLSEEDRVRLQKNPLRILDSKNEDTIILNQSAPKFIDYISKESREYHEEVKEYLTDLGIEFTENDKLVRGLDYYNQTVFEFWDEKKGAQNSVGGGGRYDGLMEILGGQPAPAIGFAMGLERVIAQMKRNKVRVPSKDDLHVFVAQLGREAKKVCLPLINELRETGIKTMGALGKGAFKNQLKIADRFKVPYCVLIGLTEVREGTAIIRDMKVGTQKTVKMDQVVAEMVKRIGKENLDFYDPKDPV
ncbi:histidine--tRNA ligase, partial [Candidatus Peregrinibacteria bacterium]|nr:histidine--tRNA ligase [Candidatus Peregrinibacteria bacterium]